MILLILLLCFTSSESLAVLIKSRAVVMFSMTTTIESFNLELRKMTSEDRTCYTKTYSQE